MRAFKICSFNNIQICNTVLLTTVTMLYITFLAFPGGTSGKEPASRCRRQETQVRSLGQEDPLEEGVATHSSILAWRIPWAEEPGGHSPWRHKELDMTEPLTHTALLRVDFRSKDKSREASKESLEWYSWQIIVACTSYSEDGCLLKIK